MMSLRKMLPSATALFVFEAAARNASFTKAATELNVTQPAISKTVSGLEAHLGAATLADPGMEGLRGTLVSDDAALTDFVRRSVGGTWHPAGTCRMGAPDDPLAVCDKNGSVMGIQGLTICDASLMPTIPRANTNVPTIMIAEKIADTIA